MGKIKNISKIATLIIFLALIRTIAEPLRLQYYSATSLQFEQIKFFIIAALITAVSLLAITILYYYAHYKAIVIIAITDIIIMVLIKFIWMQ